MPKALIKVSYKQVISSASPGSFEKNILHLSYQEYKIKQQAYNTDGTIRRFSALKAKDRRAHSLHYKSGLAIAGYIDALKNTITILQDETAHNFQFETYRFEVLESDITNEAVHKVAIHYISATLTLYEITDNYLLVTQGDKTIGHHTVPAETLRLKVQPNMAIVSYKEIKEKK